MFPDISYNQDIYAFAQGDKVRWSEIYSFGQNEERGYLPSAPGQEQSYFSDAARLRRAVEIQRHKVQQRLDGLTAKIMGEQEGERRILLQESREITDGTFDGFINVGTPGTVEEFQRRLKKGIEETASEEYLNQLRTMPIVSLDIGDKIIYAGLVRVGRGLQQFLAEEKYDPTMMADVMEIYHSLGN